jgi:uncharacterized protein YciI
VPCYAVTNLHGPAWDSTRGLREQDAWDEHASFMDELVEDGFVLIGGPLGDGPRVLLVVVADSEEAVRERLARDPWTPMGLLDVERVEPWEVLLGELPAPAG